MANNNGGLLAELSDAHQRVAVLESFPFEDNQPIIEAPTLSIFYDSYTDFNLADRHAFETKWVEEAQSIAQLRDILKQGDSFVHMLYTYRSCSRALPQIKNAEQTNKNDIYEGMFDVLEPEIKKLKTFMLFQKDTISVFCEHVKRLGALLDPTKKKKEDAPPPSDSYIMCVIQLLDKLALLDELKNMKACLNNDFSFYKRAFGFLRRGMTSNDDQTQENHTLYLFLAHQRSITNTLKAELQKIQAFDDVLAYVSNQCADFFESERFLMPSEKHTLLRVIPYALLLMDGEKNSTINLFKSKKVKLQRFATIFKVFASRLLTLQKYPVVPLYGDMQISLESVIRASPNFDDKVWGSSAEVKQAAEYDLLQLVDATRVIHNEYMAKLAIIVNEARQIVKDPRSRGNVPSTLARDVLNTVLQDWTAKVLQQSAWKYAHPNTATDLQLDNDYERVIRYNYKPEEKFALVEFIAMIKGLAGYLLKEDGLLSTILRSSVHDELQEFVQITLRDIICSVTKKKKKEVRMDLMALRSASADWFSGYENMSDPALTGQKSKDFKIQLPVRAVAPSPTQLELIRNMLFGLLSKKKDISSKYHKVLDDFYARSFFYPYLLNFVGTISSITDLGDLWYREFYLELSQRLQFPIDMSLPWILCDEILEKSDASMMEFVFYPLDLYNDAAHRALVKLKQQFLYDEIEAEVNLCFDQLVYKLSEQIFAHFKAQAASMHLDKPLKAKLEDLQVFPPGRLQSPKSRYEVILRQRHVQLLGRSIDLNHLISQRMNTYLRQNLDHIISRFEATSLPGIYELEQLFNVLHTTYKLMKKYFDLDPWSSVVSEVNESTSLVSFHGRIVLHIIFELIYDFAPNFNYNSITNRFVRTPLSFVDEVPREAAPKPNPVFLFGPKFNPVFMQVVELHQNFFGVPHMGAIFRLIGGTNFPLIVSEILQNMDLKLRNVLVPYVRELMGGMPPSSKLPMADYGTEGGFGYFQYKLNAIATYPELKSEVLQNFRELGNLIIFMKLSEQALVMYDAMTTVSVAPFLGISAENLDASLVSANANPKDQAQQSPLYVCMHNLAASLENNPKLGKAPQIVRDIVTNAWKADRLYRPTVEMPSLFKGVLNKLSQMLDAVRSEWSGSSDQLIPIDSTTEFYRLWSALLFTCCIPTSEGEMGSFELFGDGLFWAGASIIHFLGQQKRFEVFDFCYHIFNVEECSAVPTTKPAFHQFFKKVTVVRDLNNSIFNTLNTYAPVVESTPVVLPPPDSDVAADVFISVKEGNVPVSLRTTTASLYPTMHGKTEIPPPPPPDDQ